MRRGLCERAVEWKWSSASHYDSPDGSSISDLLEVSGLPPEFFTRPES